MTSIRKMNKQAKKLGRLLPKKEAKEYLEALTAGKWPMSANYSEESFFMRFPSSSSITKESNEGQ